MCESPAPASSLLPPLGLLKTRSAGEKGSGASQKPRKQLHSAAPPGVEAGREGGKGSRACSVGGTKFFFFFSLFFFFFFRSQVGSFLHSTTSGRWEDVIASALLPPPVGGGENPIWSKSVESRDGARTGRPAPPPRRTSPGRRPLPGTVIGPAPGGDPGPSPHPRLALLYSSSQQSPPLHGALVFLLLSPTAVPCPNLSPSARCRAPGALPAEPRALRRSLLPQLVFAPLPETSPRAPIALLPLLPSAAPLHLSPLPLPNQIRRSPEM